MTAKNDPPVTALNRIAEALEGIEHLLDGLPDVTDTGYSPSSPADRRRDTGRGPSSLSSDPQLGRETWKHSPDFPG